MTKRILDEKTRRDLLGYVPFSSNCRIQFTPAEFDGIKDESYRPVFDIRSLTQAELSQLKHNSQQLSKDSTSEKFLATADANLNVIRGCVLEWRNLFDTGTKEEIEFVASSSGGCDEQLFKTLPVWIKRSILDFVRKISGLSEPEELSVK